MRDNEQQTVKIELLSQWKLEAEFRNLSIWIQDGPKGFINGSKMRQQGPNINVKE